jgi:2-phospho-L-lactate/phosphoenolpyruvate guanylyltransferase
MIVYVPFKDGDHAKSRLAGALTIRQRKDLASSMLRHVVEVASRAPMVDEVVLVSPRPIELDGISRWIADSGRGLNEALHHAVRVVDAGRASPIVVLHGDLPLLRVEDLEGAMGLLREHDRVIACDRHGTGVNMMIAASRVGATFRFGHGSAGLFRAESGSIAEYASDSIAMDIDTPEDLHRLAAHPFPRARHVA